MDIQKPWKILTRVGKDMRLPQDTYKHVTREVCRIDHRILSQMPLAKFSELNEWEKTMQLHSTRHLFEERLKPYLNKPSRNGQYMELYQSELDEILVTDFKQRILERRAILVELGFNMENEICKAAYVYPLSSQRFLFLCIGMDCGIKTAYVTPVYKFRPSYQGMRYLTTEEAIKM
jgi:hypothetical protein